MAFSKKTVDGLVSMMVSGRIGSSKVRKGLDGTFREVTLTAKQALWVWDVGVKTKRAAYDQIVGDILTEDGERLGCFVFGLIGNSNTGVVHITLKADQR